ncbi:hypothetical protein [Streptomyces sp. NPDC093094]|uniref:hypothetical protein n=1 Tax=Streptomyces sp. NPDC093094 TaxID=3366026 RepID=UPI00380A7FB3
MTVTAAEHDGAAAVAAAPRPRSLFEESWDEAVVDLAPSPEDGVPGAPPAPAARRSWAAGTHGSDPSAVGDVPAGPSPPRSHRPAPDAQRPPYVPYAAVEDGGRRDAAPEVPRPGARPDAPGRVDGPTARAETYEGAMTHVGPLPPAPVAPPVAASWTAVPAHAPAPPHDSRDGILPPRTVAAPADGTAITEAAPEVVRAEPVPVAPDAVATPAMPPAESVPVVVEIERLEVRVVTDTPSGPSRERRPRPRTGPTLDEYLGSTGGRGTP